MSLAGLIPDLKNGTYTVTRSTPGAVTNGRKSASSSSTFTIEASEQPLSGRDLRALPEGERTDDKIKLYTETELRTRTGTHEADTIVIGSYTYKVITVQTWNGLGSIYYKAIISKVGAP